MFFVFLVGHFFYGVEIFFEVDFFSVSESAFGVELFFGYDIVADHMMCDFASEFVTEVGEGFGEDF